MKQPIDVACPVCFADEGRPCFITAEFPPVVEGRGVHFGRIEAANFIGVVESRMAGEPGFEPSSEQFEKALLGTGVL